MFEGEGGGWRFEMRLGVFVSLMAYCGQVRFCSVFVEGGVRVLRAVSTVCTCVSILRAI